MVDLLLDDQVRRYLSSHEIAEMRRLEIEERCIKEAEWLIDNPGDSLRKMSIEFNRSKSQIHRDLQELRHLDDDLYVQCKNILKTHRRY